MTKYFPHLIILSIATCLLIFLLKAHLLNLLIGILIIVNLLALIACALDKFKSIWSKTRLSERALLLFATPYAAPGFLVSMWLFRHKTSKASFQMKLVILIIWQILILIALFNNLELINR